MKADRSQFLKKRPFVEILKAFRKHVKLLDEYHTKAFAHGEKDYCGEVAGKLRILIHKSKSNNPLLIQVLDHFELKPNIPKAHHPEIILTLDEFLDSEAFKINVPDRGIVSVSYQELIVKWAQQIGASHEADEISTELHAVMSLPISIFGMQVAEMSLKNASSTILNVCKALLTKVEN